MGSLEWHERVAKKISSSNLQLVLLGKGLIFLILGTFFVRELAPYLTALFLGGILLSLPHWLNAWGNGLKKKSLNYTYLLMDGFGKFALLVFTGAVFAPFLWPFRWGVVIIGFLIAIPAWKEILS